MCDTPSHGSDHLWLIWKESIQNCRCYRADTACGTDGRTDGRTDRRTDAVKPIYPPTTSLFGGYNKQELLQSTFSRKTVFKYRADSRLVPSKWEMSIQSNVVSHWLGTNRISPEIGCAIQCVFCHPDPKVLLSPRFLVIIHHIYPYSPFKIWLLSVSMASTYGLFPFLQYKVRLSWQMRDKGGTMHERKEIDSYGRNKD